ncbi:MAG: DUF3883 domain-containing protein [Prolixibacteraceae bacterium]|nr:DUF3883 domain-containing protein [Prolixibacteraceae bacterium]
MENSHKLALYVAYYLSMFNDVALVNMGYNTWNNAFDDIGERLNVKRHSVKNWRDEFDPLFGHRAGWHQRPMIPSRIRVVRAFADLDEPQIREIAVDIISGAINNEEEELEQLLNVVNTDDNKTGTSRFILRAPTGRQAEEFFIQYFSEHQKPVSGSLVDCRDLGIGYDFRIESSKGQFFVEVKGLSDFSGGILFTNKEWSVAKNEKVKYFLCVVSNLGSTPEIYFIQNPAGKLNPKKSIYTSIQIQWTLSANELKSCNGHQ